MATSAAAIPYVLAAAAAAGQYINTQNTAKRQDEQAAQSIINQGNIQRKADAQVNDTIQQLQGSTADKARTARLNDYMTTLQQSKARSNAGLDNPVIGGNTFQADSANAANAVQNYGTQTANLLARIDAPTVQRQDEGTLYGNLASNLGVIGEQSQGQAFLDQLRLAAIRRNAKIDLAAGLMNAGAGAMAGSAGSASGFGAQSGNANVPFNSLTGAGVYRGPQSVYGGGF